MLIEIIVEYVIYDVVYLIVSGFEWFVGVKLVVIEYGRLCVCECSVQIGCWFVELIFQKLFECIVVYEVEEVGCGFLVFGDFWCIEGV